MLSIIKKEINSFFSSLIAYVVIGIFLILLGLMMWVFPDYSILSYNYASLDQLFALAPLIFLFLIPAITMRSFSEEIQAGTLEFLLTKPLKDWEIVLGKFFASLILVAIALLPTLIYYYSVYQLGSPKGNIDSGAIISSYIALLCLAACFCAVGMFCSVLTKNQIVAFLLSVLLCYLMYYGFMFFSKLPVFFGTWDDIIQRMGIDDPYTSMSRGVIDSRDVVYFLSIIFLFNWLSFKLIQGRRF